MDQHQQTIAEGGHVPDTRRGDRDVNPRDTAGGTLEITGGLVGYGGGAGSALRSRPSGDNLESAAVGGFRRGAVPAEVLSTRKSWQALLANQSKALSAPSLSKRKLDGLPRYLRDLTTPGIASTSPGGPGRRVSSEGGVPPPTAENEARQEGIPLEPWLAVSLTTSEVSNPSSDPPLPSCRSRWDYFQAY
jgi:hypothetical protein